MTWEWPGVAKGPKLELDCLRLIYAAEKLKAE